jgi:hypothetical protein
VQQLEKDAGGGVVAPALEDISQALTLGKDTLRPCAKRAPRRRTP